MLNLNKNVNFFITFNFKKKLFFKIINKAGRNNSGKITFFSKGRKHKSNSILIYKNNFNFSKIINFFNTSNRSGKLALIQTFDNFLFFILSTNYMKKNDLIMFSFINKKILNKFILIKNIGDNLNDMQPGVNICNLGWGKSNLNKIACSGGLSAKIISKTNYFSRIKLKSGVIIELKNFYKAYYGNIKINDFYIAKNKCKASFMYFLGIKSKVRGVAMNPCDHPHGGGEGKKSALTSPKNPFGKFIKKSTRKKKKIY